MQISTLSYDIILTEQKQNREHEALTNIFLFFFSAPELAPSEPKLSGSPKRMPLDPVTEPVHTDPYPYVKSENKPECPIPLRPEQSVAAGQPYYISGKC